MTSDYPLLMMSKRGRDIETSLGLYFVFLYFCHFVILDMCFMECIYVCVDIYVFLYVLYEHEFYFYGMSYIFWHGHV